MHAFAVVNGPDGTKLISNKILIHADSFMTNVSLVGIGSEILGDVWFGPPVPLGVLRVCLLVNGEAGRRKITDIVDIACNDLIDEAVAPAGMEVGWVCDAHGNWAAPAKQE